MTNEEVKKKLDCTARITGNELIKSALNIITVQEKEIERLKAENETYCKQINQAYDTGYDDGYESCQDDIKKADELLKEYE